MTRETEGGRHTTHRVLASKLRPTANHTRIGLRVRESLALESAQQRAIEWIIVDVEPSLAGCSSTNGSQTFGPHWSTHHRFNLNLCSTSS